MKPGPVKKILEGGISSDKKSCASQEGGTASSSSQTALQLMRDCEHLVLPSDKDHHDCRTMLSSAPQKQNAAQVRPVETGSTTHLFEPENEPRAFSSPELIRGGEEMRREEREEPEKIGEDRHLSAPKTDTVANAAALLISPSAGKLPAAPGQGEENKNGSAISSKLPRCRRQKAALNRPVQTQLSQLHTHFEHGLSDHESAGLTRSRRNKSNKTCCRGSKSANDGSAVVPVEAKSTTSKSKRTFAPFEDKVRSGFLLRKRVSETVCGTTRPHLAASAKFLQGLGIVQKGQKSGLKPQQNGNANPTCRSERHHEGREPNQPVRGNRFIFYALDGNTRQVFPISRDVFQNFRKSNCDRYEGFRKYLFPPVVNPEEEPVDEHNQQRRVEAAPAPYNSSRDEQGSLCLVPYSRGHVSHNTESDIRRPLELRRQTDGTDRNYSQHPSNGRRLHFDKKEKWLEKLVPVRFSIATCKVPEESGTESTSEDEEITINGRKFDAGRNNDGTMSQVGLLTLAPEFALAFLRDTETINMPGSTRCTPPACTRPAIEAVQAHAIKAPRAASATAAPSRSTEPKYPTDDKSGKTSSLEDEPVVVVAARTFQ
ncbi:unnamed protein product [Amoebophrya sp. A120]|nr:unnamed protein product [Amoebophrya sp. A120]|eukprot:GSA120T00009203001.1